MPCVGIGRVVAMTGPRTARGNERCEVVLAVARRLLVAEGFEAFGMRRIAELADMGLGNLQYYFATRDDLLDAVLRAEAERDLAALRAGSSDPVRQLTDAVAVLLASWVSDGGSVYAPLTLLAEHDERFARLRTEIYDAFYAQLAAVVRAIDPSASGAVARTRAVLITAVIDGTSMQLGVLGPTARRRLLADVGRLVVGVARGDC